MRKAIVALCAAMAAMPAMAQTPGDDLARCERLYATYERYSNTGGESRSGSSFASAEARAALDDCRRGNTRAGIAVLERRLRSLGFRI